MTKQNIKISASFDKTVYPLNSIMHIRVRTNKIIKNELIYVEIYDQKNKIIYSRRINPEKAKSLEDSGYLYQTSISMQGNDWEIGKSYTLLAKYCGMKVSKSMIIAKRKPLVHTDKSVYLIGADMTVTVITPDLDRDSERPEVIGNDKDHSLTISSRFGILKNYKLYETGNSTGIFQGLVEIVPPYSIKNGKKIRNKARGNGPFNGHLPVGPLGEEIIIEFKSKSGNSNRSAYSSNFGAAVELDQKIYCPTDKIFLTIVAPDYNFDSNKLDVLGNRPDSKIIISTSKGKISNYKLIETGRDTGIFVGEIILTGSKEIFSELKRNKNFGITKGIGPLNSRLACSSDDKITVTFDAEGLSLQGSSKIEFNIGEIQFDKEIYSKRSIAKITVIDPDMNLDPNKKDFVDIQIWSDSDLQGLKLKMTETNEATGIFEGNVILTDETVPVHNKLKILEGDRIFAKYTDHTLPRLYSRSKKLDIIATAKILSKVETQASIRILKNSSTPHDGKYLEPEILTIKSGDAVSWINDDTVAHTVTSGDIKGEGPDGIFDSSLFGSGETFSHKFNEKGTFNYFCMFHPWKTGKIIVK